MLDLKRSLDARGHCVLEMPTGTGKTVSLLSLITSYQLAHPETGKLIYCTRTVPEMRQTVRELKNVMEYRDKCLRESGRNVHPGKGAREGAQMSGERAKKTGLHVGAEEKSEGEEKQGNRKTAKAQRTSDSRSKGITAVCLSSRRNMCINSRVLREATGEAVDTLCRQLTAQWVREREQGGVGEGGGDGVDRKVADIEDVEGASPSPSSRPTPSTSSSCDDHGGRLCSFYEGYERQGTDAGVPPGVYDLEDLKALGRRRGWCPYFLTRHVIHYADVVVFNYQYMLDPKISGIGE